LANLNKSLVLDIGFAGDKKASCGSLINALTPINLTFVDVCENLTKIIVNSKFRVNLVVEAPLSVAFLCEAR
jgi:hypothetical protein